MFVTLATVLALAQLPDGGVEASDGGVTEPVDAGVATVADAGAPRAPVTLTAKWGEGVVVKAGDFSLQVRGRVQARAEAIVPTEGSTVNRLNQLLIRRARLSLIAKYTDAWTMTVQLAFATLDMEPDAPNVLRDANLTWSGLRDLNVRVGQMKVPFGRQRVISSGNQQMVDRSIIIGELSLDRDVGILLRSDDLFGLGGRLSYALGVMGGDGRNRLGTNVGLLYVARAQVNPFGKFDDLVAGDLERLEHPRLSIGLAAARNVATVRQRSTIGTTFRNGALTYDHLAADLLFKWRGFSLEAEALLRFAERPNLIGSSTTEWARAGWGYYAQAGYSPVQAFEVSARWSQLRPFVGTDPSFRHQRELGVGVGWYPKKHDLKLQGDFFWLPVGERFDVGSFQVRAQLQLAF
ncbi:MAG: porin [Myxococcaceae bacterium]|nr:porin [Myxococcaceae bacterium]